jgi:hypothetical protein
MGARRSALAVLAIFFSRGAEGAGTTAMVIDSKGTSSNINYYVGTMNGPYSVVTVPTDSTTILGIGRVATNTKSILLEYSLGSGMMPVTAVLTPDTWIGYSIACGVISSSGTVLFAGGYNCSAGGSCNTAPYPAFPSIFRYEYGAHALSGEVALPWYGRGEILRSMNRAVTALVLSPDGATLYAAIAAGYIMRVNTNFTSSAASLSASSVISPLGGPTATFATNVFKGAFDDAGENIFWLFGTPSAIVASAGGYLWKVRAVIRKRAAPALLVFAPLRAPTSITRRPPPPPSIPPPHAAAPRHGTLEG